MPMLFNDIIRQLDLVDVPLTGRQYTSSNHRANHCLSKLDRFLISGNFDSLFPNVSVIVNIASDDIPIVLRKFG